MFGSLMARFAVQARADALRGLVIYGAPGIARYRLPIGLLLAAIGFGMHPSQRSITRFAQWAFVPPDASRRPDREWFEMLLAYVVACAKRTHVQRTMRQLIRIGKQRIPDEELRRIRIPTALLWGRHDRMVRLRVAEDLPRGLACSSSTTPDTSPVDCPNSFLRALQCARTGGVVPYDPAD
jgi:pimeloyl-ACP methyl ester carboxylesterase